MYIHKVGPTSRKTNKKRTLQTFKLACICFLSPAGSNQHQEICMNWWTFDAFQGLNPEIVECSCCSCVFHQPGPRCLSQMSFDCEFSCCLKSLRPMREKSCVFLSGLGGWRYFLLASSLSDSACPCAVYDSSLAFWYYWNAERHERWRDEGRREGSVKGCMPFKKWRKGEGERIEELCTLINGLVWERGFFLLRLAFLP